MFRLFIFSSLFASSFAATQCVGAENQLPPIAPGTCPPGLIFTDDNMCCLTPGVQIVGGNSATTRATTQFNGIQTTTRFNVINRGSTASIGTNNCVDLLNPRTGVSDCPARAALCQNPTYYSLMTIQCPRTCNRCSTNTNRGTGGCVDLINPRTGTSDCPQRVSYCNDVNYSQVMRVQCPRTCGMCSGTGAGQSGFGGINSMITTTRSPLNGNCIDQINPTTRKSDCPSLRFLCTSSVYRGLMRIQCPATCNMCGTNQTNLNLNGIQFG